jgi:dTDP-4-amino-4,6-dideoxygalactose transaminase
MVDLVSQYHRLKEEIDEAIRSVIESGSFINGEAVKQFASNLASYLNVPYVIPCGNGTDALQIALMRSELERGDEVIVPSFTYYAAVEAAVLLGLTPVAADVDPYTYNIDPASVEAAISSRTRAIIVVHLFGQSCDMYPILDIAKRHNIIVIEDNAQSLGSDYIFPDGTARRAGTMGNVGMLSFFPTKMLGCFGDGGALITGDPEQAELFRKTTVHGQSAKYRHQIIGVNSRLDTLQAAILDVKLRYLDEAVIARRAVAAYYDQALAGLDSIILPQRHPSSTHVYNQYTVRVTDDKRDELQAYLKAEGVPTTVYYPLSVDRQEAFIPYLRLPLPLEHARLLTRQVLSLPMHTEMTVGELEYITGRIKTFFSTK